VVAGHAWPVLAPPPGHGRVSGPPAAPYDRLAAAG